MKLLHAAARGYELGYRLRFWAIGLLILLLAANVVRLIALRYGPSVPVLGSLRPFVAHTVHLKAVRHEAGRPPEVRLEETYALRADGSHVRLERGVGFGGPYVYRDIVFADGRRIAVDDVKETTQSTKVHAPRLARNPDTDCLYSRAGRLFSAFGEHIVGRSYIGRYRVVSIKGRLATSAYAPELSCALLSGSTDPTLGAYMTRDLIDVVVGEPDPILFHVPSRYYEVPPKPRETK